MGLGDHISKALSQVGITEERVKEWLGDCHCLERREKLNWLGFWAVGTLRGTIRKSKEWLEENLKV